MGLLHKMCCISKKILYQNNVQISLIFNLSSFFFFPLFKQDGRAFQSSRLRKKLTFKRYTKTTSGRTVTTDGYKYYFILHFCEQHPSFLILSCLLMITKNQDRWFYETFLLTPLLLCVRWLWCCLWRKLDTL